MDKIMKNKGKLYKNSSFNSINIPVEWTKSPPPPPSLYYGTKVSAKFPAVRLNLVCGKAPAGPILIGQPASFLLVSWSIWHLFGFLKTNELHFYWSAALSDTCLVSYKPMSSIYISQLL